MALHGQMRNLLQTRRASWLQDIILTTSHRSEEFGKRGAAAPTDPDVKLADFSYENEDVAQEIIVRAWGDPTFKDTLLGNQNQGHTQTPQEIADRVAAAVTALSGLPNKPFTLKSAIVLTEAEYNAGWDTDDNDQVVLCCRTARAPQEIFSKQQKC